MLLSADWSFVNEGNANIIIEYIGEEEKFIGKVLRLTKMPVYPSSLPHAAQAILSFQECLIGSLFGEEYKINSEVIPVDRAFLERIEMEIQPSRRPDRLKKRINMDQQYALLLDNVFALAAKHNGALAVEIKPKWGFLDPSTKRCRFCIHNISKSLSCKSYRRSLYCPQFLFSQDEGKMIHSISSLLKVPNNNLRVYRNGNPQDDLDDESIRRIVRILHSSQLLPKLAAAQQQYHEDVFELEDLLEKENTSTHLSGDVSKDIKDGLLYEVDQLLHFQPSRVILPPSSPPVESFENGNGALPVNRRQELINRISRFLVSLSLKDLSVVVVVGNENLAKKEYSIFILDCDPKPAKKLFSTLAMERELSTIPSFCLFRNPSSHTVHLPSF